MQTKDVIIAPESLPGLSADALEQLHHLNALFVKFRALADGETHVAKRAAMKAVYHALRSATLFALKTMHKLKGE